jgi:hypothetical protein
MMMLPNDLLGGIAVDEGHKHLRQVVCQRILEEGRGLESKLLSLL